LFTFPILSLTVTLRTRREFLHFYDSSMRALKPYILVFFFNFFLRCDGVSYFML
jgi:hypothetical protein